MLLSSLWLISIQSRCKDEPTPDPCLAKKTPTADFAIAEMVGDSLVTTDTISNTEMQVVVHASPLYQSYKWKIGSDPREWTTSRVTLSFDNSLSGETIQVTLIAKQAVDKTCFLDDDGIDTIVKKFTIACPSDLRCINAPVTFKRHYLGKWRGIIQDEPNKEFDVSIVDFGRDPNERDDTVFYDMRIYNLPENCGGNQKTGACGGQIISPYFFAPTISEGGYKAFYCRREYQFTCCPPMSMFGKIDPNDRNRITIYMNYTDGRKRIFNGRRL